ncbi:MAG TPA: nuclear transport factor 2 family protein [Gemmatimonadales bacterium]|nr:nuclear transport factor 2 family protein [Gemmatimonadales bacterium]
MRRLLLTPILSVLALGALPPAAGQAQTESATRSQVTALVARYDSAWGRRDTSVVGHLLAPRYQYFTSRGGVSSRAETLEFLRDSTYVLRRAQRSELSVSPDGPVAIVSSRWQGEGSYRGEPFTDDQRCGQTWTRAGGTWQLLSEHCVQIAAPPPTQ